MEEKKIKVVKTRLEPQSVRDIQVFFVFAKIYRRFIRNFSRIATLLTSMLRITDNDNLSAQSNQNEKNQDTLDGGASGAGSGRVDVRITNLSIAGKSVKSKKLKLTKPKKSDLVKTHSFGTDFLISKAKKAFIHLQKTFTEAPIFRHFDPECHIRIKTDVLEYTICGVPSQMTSDQHFSGYVTHKDLNSDFAKSKIGQWHSIAFFSQKIIPVETRYKTHNQEFLAIIEAFKTWYHYLEGYKHKVFVLNNHNNFH